jgi:hypothetical protein
MNNFFRALIAGYGAKKIGGGCLGTIVVFILIWVALGQCSSTSRTIPAPETYPADIQVSIPVHPFYTDNRLSILKEGYIESLVIGHWECSSNRWINSGKGIGHKALGDSSFDIEYD